MSPLDEVRTALAFFDETLFSVVPRVYREARCRARSAAAGPSRRCAAAGGEAADAGRTGTRPPRAPPFLAWEIVDRRRPRRQPGGHRRGHGADAPDPRRSRPARLRGGRDAPVADDRRRDVRRERDSAARRAGSRATPSSCPISIASSAGASRTSRIASGSGSSPSGSAGRAPILTGQAAPLTGRYGDAAELDGELAEIQDALVADGLERVAWGEVADLRWQLETFGFHLAALEVRQHSAVQPGRSTALQGGTPPTEEVVPGVSAGEVGGDVLPVIRRRFTGRFGPASLERYIVCTSSANDVKLTM